MMSCYETVIDFKWSNQLWPKQNKQPKPTRSNVVNDFDLKLIIANDLAMSKALKYRYNEEISEEHLQADLNRMARNSKDPKKLIKLFNALHNDPVAVANCVSKPYLVKKQLRSQFEWDKSIHDELKNTVLTAIKNPSKPINGISQIYTFELSETPNFQDNQGNNLNYHQYINEYQFKTKLNELKVNQQKLMAESENFEPSETADQFYFEELLSHDASSFSVRRTSWPKLSFDEWWNTHKVKWETSDFTLQRNQNLTLPTVTLNNISTPNGAINEFWLLNNLPTGRENHTAIWTGSEMIIWGGRDQFGNWIDSGARYDPVSDTWARLPLFGTPAARQNHHAFWTGSEMIVWGGQMGQLMEPGGLFNPNTNTWTLITESNAPHFSDDHSAVWAEDKMIVWANNDIASAGIYDPTNDQWIDMSTTNQPSPRFNPSALWTGNQMIIWGGNDFNNTYLNSGAAYNLNSNSWTPTTQLNAPLPRSTHPAVWVNERMYIMGGYAAGMALDAASYDAVLDSWSSVNMGGAPQSIYSGNVIGTSEGIFAWPGDGNAGAWYNTTTDSWSPVNTVRDPSNRNDFTMVWTGDEVIIWGGQTGTQLLDTGGRYHVDSDSWQATFENNNIRQRLNPTSIWTGNEMIIWGGRGIVRSGGIYNPYTDNWTTTPSINPNVAHYRHTSVWTGSEMIIWGGTTGGDGNGTHNTGARFNPLTQSWNEVSMINPPQKRADHTAVWTGDGMIIWGGRGSTPQIGELQDGGIYFPDTDSWTTINMNDAPFERDDHKAIWTGDEMVIWGGSAGLSGGRYNPQNDSWSTTSNNNTPVNAYPNAIWDGSHIIFWTSGIDEGKKYDPVLDTWSDMANLATLTDHNRNAAVWTGEEMIVWGTLDSVSGGRYRSATNQWIPTNEQGTLRPTVQYVAEWTGSSMLIWGGVPFDNISVYFPDVASYDLIFSDSF